VASQRRAGPHDFAPLKSNPNRIGAADDIVAKDEVMTKRKQRKPKTDEQIKWTPGEEFALPSAEERLPSYIPDAYQVAMGTREEVLGWLRRIPRDRRVILISFPSETGYRTYGPIYWHVARKLPEIASRVQRRQFEQLVNALTESRSAQPGAASGGGFRSSSYGRKYRQSKKDGSV
jgi:hypothetical protein